MDVHKNQLHPLESKDHALGGAWHPNTLHGSQGTGARLSDFFLELSVSRVCA